ncbi:putative UDP-GalNAc:polypeptide N-acetylgalactosaminyltransferase [Danaus plexippus plexippus]|uniref:UDP-GalNAc:polypeptide N-acetylgalactosaminyltransferase n=1 Tax=Danaus plexippus plexippus TaxID=278856 RepID=A0A212ELJ6_DANPL|nr:putative UDP-GalNAc:polypeptide N-acetylgalactosaminyltransferase [Danaus plexippus plexippus]
MAPFQLMGWESVGPSSPHLTYRDRITAIKNKEFPLGKFGKPVFMANSIKGTLRLIIKKGWEENAFNQFVSDLIPIDRPLLDLRDKWCLERYSSKLLPQASVVICFFNEAWSTLLRTLHSVLNRSPPHLLREVLLIDDFSDMDHIKVRLENYTRKFPNVILIRTSQREGLIRARIVGAKKASAPVLVFLDSHCECTEGWLEPLLERLVENPKIVASPVIDHIDPNTFEYISQNPKDIYIGGFNWNLKFIWRSIEYKRENFLLPIKTPTIAGGLFAIDKEFFYSIGYYDEGFDVWGGENLELSFKVWMCGGSLEIVPCSHVGHIFRENFPYYTSGETFKRNAARLAEVWLDDYAKIFYERIGNADVSLGDVTAQKELRKKLKCKSFNWYLRNVYPEKKIPKSNVASGQIYNIGKRAVCLDASVTPPQVTGFIHIMPCHGQGGNQVTKFIIFYYKPEI